MKKITPVHPGEMLKEEFLDPLKISQREFARIIQVPANRVNQIINGKRSITGDTAIRFSLALKTSAEFWLRLQDRYELEKTYDEIGDSLKKEIQPIVH
jgi:addiction module HigA family antidote